MAVIPEEIFINGSKEIVKLDRASIPTGEGTALYIRPFVLATQAKFGVKISDEYRFIIFTGLFRQFF